MTAIDVASMVEGMMNQMAAMQARTIAQLQAQHSLELQKLMTSPEKPRGLLPPPDDPRVGGIDLKGAWSGKGFDGLGTTPASGFCYREFRFNDPAKCHSELSKVETYCRNGLKQEPQYHFSMPLEQASTGTSKATVYDCLEAFADFAKETGLESVFTIEGGDGLTINMFEDLGSLNDGIVDNWVMVLQNGLLFGEGEDPCSLDLLNLKWSSQALLNSCSPEMKKHVERTLLPSDRSGPKILWTIISASETYNSSVIRDLCTKLSQLSLRSIPGENLQTFATAVLVQVRGIRMRCREKEIPTDLTQLSITGACDGTDETIRQEAKKLLLDSNKAGSTISPEQAMDQLVKSWRSAVSLKIYGPDNADRQKAHHQHAALVAAANQAQTDAQPGNLHRTGQGVPSSSTCHTCGGRGHFAKDCPSTKTSGGAQISKGRSQLSDTDKRHLQLIKAFKLPSNIKETDYINVTDPSNNNEVIGEYCNVCKRIIRKGPGMHWTGKHVKKSALNRQSPPPSSEGAQPSPAPAPALLLTSVQGSPSVDPALLKSFQEFQAFQALQSANLAANATSHSQYQPLLQLQGANYTTPIANLFCHSTMGHQGSAEDEFHDAIAPSTKRVSFDTWPSLKGHGGQGY